MYPGFKAQNHPQQVATRGVLDAVDDRATSAALFGSIAREHGPFTIDVAASASNAKCERFFTLDDDGLAQSWAGERVWCNPPFSSIRAWVTKAWQEWERVDSIAMLLPANRTEQAWWQDLVEPYRDIPGSPLRVKFLRGRPRFISPGLDRVLPNQRPPFGCCLLLWRSLAPDLNPASLQAELELK
jgi:phage N-6-adenine-methyltransferase